MSAAVLASSERLPHDTVEPKGSHDCDGAGVGLLDECDGKSVAPQIPHEHALIASSDTEDWVCDLCGTEFIDLQAPRFTCSQGCDFDLCEDCHHSAASSRVPPAVAEESFDASPAVSDSQSALLSRPCGAAAMPSEALAVAEESFDTAPALGDSRSALPPPSYTENVTLEAEAVPSAPPAIAAKSLETAPAVADGQIAFSPTSGTQATDFEMAPAVPSAAFEMAESVEAEEAFDPAPAVSDGESAVAPHSLSGSEAHEQSMDTPESQSSSTLSEEDRRRFGLEPMVPARSIASDEHGDCEVDVPSWTSLTEDDRRRFGLCSRVACRSGEIPMCRTLIQLSEAGLGQDLKRLQDTELVLQILNGKT